MKRPKDWSLRARVRVGFWSYAAVLTLAAVLFWTYESSATDWDWLYRVMFPVAAVSAFVGGLKYRIGTIYWWLFPTQLVASVRLVDFWQNFLFSNHADVSASTFLLGSLGWAFLVISISFIDLLDNRLCLKIMERYRDVGKV